MFTSLFYHHPPPVPAYAIDNLERKRDELHMIERRLFTGVADSPLLSLEDRLQLAESQAAVHRATKQLKKLLPRPSLQKEQYKG